MKTMIGVAIVLSSLGFIASFIALVVLIMGDNPFLSELTITEITSHPIAWLIFTGFFLFKSTSDWKKCKDYQERKPNHPWD